jgi:hypothetical protein
MPKRTPGSFRSASFPLLVVLLLAAGTASAGEPAAIVEDVSSDTIGVGFLDYLEEGRTISLGTGDTLVLGFLRSCQRETISGGTVTVGAEASTVDGGTVQRERVECAGGQVRLSSAQAGKSGAVVFRAGAAGSKAQPAPSVTIQTTSPLFDLGPDGAATSRTVEIERVDRPPETHVVTVTGRAVDLADSGVTLHPGGIYTARANNRSITFRVDDYAAPGGGPVISRLIRF